MLAPAKKIGKPIIVPEINTGDVDDNIEYNNIIYKIPPQKGEFRGVYKGYAFYDSEPHNFMIELKTGKCREIPYRGELIVHTAGIQIINKFIKSQFKIID